MNMMLWTASIHEHDVVDDIVVNMTLRMASIRGEHEGMASIHEHDVADGIDS